MKAQARHWMAHSFLVQAPLRQTGGGVKSLFSRHPSHPSLKPFRSASTCCCFPICWAPSRTWFPTCWLLLPWRLSLLDSSFSRHLIWFHYCPFHAEKGVRGRWSRGWQRSWPQSGAQRARPRHLSSSRRRMLLTKSEPSVRLVEFTACIVHLCFCRVFLRIPSCERGSGKWSSSQAWLMSSSVAKGRGASKKANATRMREPIVARQRAVVCTARVFRVQLSSLFLKERYTLSR